MRITTVCSLSGRILVYCGFVQRKVNLLAELTRGIKSSYGYGLSFSIPLTAVKRKTKFLHYIYCYEDIGLRFGCEKEY